MSVRVSVPPINQIYKNLTNAVRVQIWLIDKPKMKIEGIIRGFDEYMNVVLDDAEETFKDMRSPLGRILLKGDNICLIRPV